ncbi:hypothetical protein [Nannocystis pusilla]|uniref:hypothetical protein n=1 Tax=Nannocystis pusilla TaxID=889268 RepID=UPI003B807C95
MAAHRVLVVLQAQVERIELQLLRQLVDRQLERERPCGCPGARMAVPGPAWVNTSWLSTRTFGQRE